MDPVVDSSLTVVSFRGFLQNGIICGWDLEFLVSAHCSTKYFVFTYFAVITFFSVEMNFYSLNLSCIGSWGILEI